MNWYKMAKLDRLYTKQDMLNTGADGYLDSAILLWIPLSKVTGRDPEPRTFVDEQGQEQEFVKGRKIDRPIEVVWNKENDDFILYSGNHRVKQAEINQQESIRAFVGIESEDNLDDFVELSKRYELV